MFFESFLNVSQVVFRRNEWWVEGLPTFALSSHEMSFGVFHQGEREGLRVYAHG